jgi:PAS domain S-box-containing protein
MQQTMQQTKFSILPWVVGIYCLFVAVVMLVTPHQFNAPAYHMFHGNLPGWGVVYLMAGVFLLVTAVFGSRYILSLVAHGFAGTLLLIIAYGFTLVQGWPGIVNFAMLGFVTILSGFLAMTNGETRFARSDFLFLALGIGAVISGTLLLLLPENAKAGIFLTNRALMPFFGVAFLAAGSLLVTVLVWSSAPKNLFWAAHMLLGLVYIGWLLSSSIPGRFWTGVGLYGLFGSVLLTMPWLHTKLIHFDPYSLRTRLVITLVMVAAAPLITQSTLITNQEEQNALSQSLALQRRLVGGLSQHMTDYLALHRAAVESLTKYPLLELSPDEQHLILRDVAATYPHGEGFALFDAAGQPLARSDDQQGVPIDALPLFRRVLATGATVTEMSVSSVRNVPRVAMMSPIRDGTDTIVGIIGLAVDTDELAHVLAHPSANSGEIVYLVDEQGQVIAFPESMGMALLQDLSQSPPVAHMLATGDTLGSLRYGIPSQEQLAGYARLPEYGWGIIAEFPTSVALGGIRSSRDAALWILLLLVVITILIGVVIGNVLTRPLQALTLAMSQLGSGNGSPHLPRSNFSETRSLTNAFTDLRARLVQQTRQREQAEAEKQKSERRFRLLAETSIFGIVMSDHDNRLTYLNPSMQRLIGYSQDDADAGLVRWEKLTPPEYAELDRTAIQELIEKGITSPYEKVYIAKDGRRVPILIGAAVLEKESSSVAIHQIEDGSKPNYDEFVVAAYIVDLTLLRKTESALRESERRYQGLIEALPQLVWTARPDGWCDYLSPQWVAFTGIPESEQLGSGWLNALHPDDRERAADVWVNTVGGRAVYDLDYRIRRYDGEYCWFQTHGVPLRDEQGTIIKWIGTCTNIQDRKEAEIAQQLLAKAGELLTSTFDENSILASITKLAVPQLADWCAVDLLQDDGTLKRSALAHVDPEKVALGYEISSRFPPRPSISGGIFQVLRDGQPILYTEISQSVLNQFAHDQENLRMLESLGVCSMMILPLNARDRAHGTITFVNGESGRHFDADTFALGQDLAHRAALSVDNARLYNQAQKALQARNEFLSIAAHELKTPITSLRGFAQLVLRQFNRGNGVNVESMRQAMQTIDDQSVRLAHLISQLLDISRIEVGRLMIEREQTDINALVRRVVETIGTSSPIHPVTLHESASIIANVDPIRFEQIITNLLSNAVRYSPEGSPIDENTFRIRVTDQGLGIPPDKRSALFQRFSQAHLDQHLGGLGLGLYITQQIVEMHGGTIGFEPGEEKGTRFTVTMPLSALD